MLPCLVFRLVLSTSILTLYTAVMSFEILFVCLWNFVVGPKVSGGGCAPRSAVHVHVHVLVLAGGASHAPPLGCRSPCRPDRGLGRSSGGAPSRARTPVLREVPRPREVHHETEVHHRLALLPRNRLMVRPDYFPPGCCYGRSV